MNPLHPCDKELFQEHPDPLWEALMLQHPSLINATLPHYGPMLHFMAKAITAINVLEIGVAQGYTSFFLASAVRYNNARFGVNGKFIGIDIADKSSFFNQLRNEGHPVEFWHMDSMEVTPKMLNGIEFDLIFQDGWHNTGQCLRELDFYYDYLKGNGDGYLVIHDVYAYCEEYFKEIQKDKKYKFEYVRFLNNYGLAICRKMDGYNYDKVFWPEGDVKIKGVT